MSTDFYSDIKTKLNVLLCDNKDDLPEKFNSSRYINNSINGLKFIKDVTKYNTQNIADGLLQGAFLDLDYQSKEFYLIPNKPQTLLNFRVGYKGEIKLIKKYAIGKPITNVYAKLIRKGDDFKCGIKNGHSYLEFNPLPFSDAEIIGVFSVVQFEDDSFIYETLSKKEVDYLRATFSSKNPVWHTSPGEMTKKCAINRIRKQISIDLNAKQYTALNPDDSEQQLFTPNETKSNINSKSLSKLDQLFAEENIDELFGEDTNNEA